MVVDFVCELMAASLSGPAVMIISIINMIVNLIIIIYECDGVIFVNTFFLAVPSLVIAERSWVSEN